MNSEIIFGIIRHLLTGAGTILTTKGIADSGTVETAVGAIMTLASFVWSITHKVQAANK